MFLQKIIKLGLYLPLILPFILTSTTKYPWHFGKTVLFQILVEILLVLGAINFAFLSPHRGETERGVSSIKLQRRDLTPDTSPIRGGNFANERQHFIFTWLDGVFYLFVLSQLISAIFGVNFIRSFWGDQARAQGVFTWFHFGIYYFLLRQFFLDKKDWRVFGSLAIIGAVFSSILAWIGPRLDMFEGIISPEVRLGGLIGNPIFLASYLTIPLFLALAWFLGRAGRSRWPWLIGMVLILATIIQTGVRGAFISIVAAAGLIIVLFWIFSESKKIKLSMVAIVVLMVSVFAALFAFNRQSDWLAEHAYPLSRFFSFTSLADTGGTRLMAWKAALQGWQDRPWLGWGPENYRDLFDKHYNPKFLSHGLTETVWDKPHNYPLEVLSSLGIVGAFAYIALLLILFRYFWKLIKTVRDAGRRASYIIMLGGALAYVVQSSFAFETSNSLFLWIVFIAGVSFLRDAIGDSLLRHPSPAAVKGGGNEKVEVRGRRQYWKIIVNKIAFVLVVILALLSPYTLYANHRLFKASVLISEAQDASEAKQADLWESRAQAAAAYQVPFMWEQAIFLTQDLGNLDRYGILKKETAEIFGDQTAVILENQIKNHPESYFFKFWLAQLYSIMGENVSRDYFDKSNQILSEAELISPDRPQIALIRAKNYLLMGDDQKAVETLSALVQKYPEPEYQEPHWFLGIALAKNGDKKRGMEELEKGMGYGLNYAPGNIQFMIDLYAELKDYAKIIPLYERLIEGNPNRASGYYANLAAVYAELGNEEKTVYYLNQAVEMDPSLLPEAREFLRRKGIEVNKYL